MRDGGTVALWRTVHILRNSLSSDPTWNIIGAGRFGEDGFESEPLRSLSREQVGDWLARQGLSYSGAERIIESLRTAESLDVKLPFAPGPKVVRAWFDTVINPLVSSLQDELTLLERHNWTFVYNPPRLEMIRSISQYLPHDALANLDQMRRCYAETLEPPIARHDRSVERLQYAVVSMNSALTESAEFIGLCDSLFSAERLADLGVRSTDEVFGPYPDSERYEVLAQYVVNSTGRLSSHYSTAKFWNHHREALLGALDLPEIRNQYDYALTSGEALSQTSQVLSTELRDLRDQLSMRFDVPLVTTTR
jgi:hypothetical protein